jgi:hypothetical protein
MAPHRPVEFEAVVRQSEGAAASCGLQRVHPQKASNLSHETPRLLVGERRSRSKRRLQ